MIYKDYKDYRDVVDSITAFIVKDNGIIIPKDDTIDHIFPVSYGYRLNIPPELMADVKNLQIMSRKENSIKSNNCDSIPIYIQQYMLGLVKEIIKYDNKERQKKGIERAKKNGVYKGRKIGSCEKIDEFINKPKIQQVISLLQEGNKSVDIIKMVDISMNTITKVKKLLSKNDIERYFK